MLDDRILQSALQLALESQRTLHEEKGLRDTIQRLQAENLLLSKLLKEGEMKKNTPATDQQVWKVSDVHSRCPKVAWLKTELLGTAI